MDALIKSRTGFSLGIISAMVVTASLFMTLPMLTQLQPTPSTTTEIEPILIEKWKPTPPPSDTRDDPEKPTQTPPETKVVQKDRPRWVQPKVDFQRGNLLTAMNDGIEIELPSIVHDVAQITNPTYEPGEVDQQPKVLRSFSPQYPYRAERDNVEGWVVLRFIVDTEGIVGNMEVVAAEPAGIFEAAALKAVARYRFKPAIKNGEAVNCITKQRIRFRLD